MMWSRDPWEDIRRFEKSMNHLFDEFWSRGPKLLPSGETSIKPFEEEVTTWEPYTDIQETDKEIVLTADIPGVKKEDIKIDATEDGIEISAETSHEKNEEKEGFVRKERGYSRFYRNYTLPTSVDPHKVRARYNNGVLEVKLPKKKVGKKSTTIKVE